MATETNKDSDLHPQARFYCGLDVHKHQLSVAVYGKDDSNAECLRESLFNTTKASLETFWQFADKFQPSGFVMEATGIYHHIIAQFLEQKQQQASYPFEICIVNPADVAGIPGRAKCDRLDAATLAKHYAAGLLRSGKGIIPVLEDLKALFRMGYRLEQDRTALKNRIKKTLDRAGFRPAHLDLNYEWVNAFLYEYTRFTGTLKSFINMALNEGVLVEKHYSKILKALPELEPFYALILSGAQKALIRQDLFDLDLKTSRQTLLNVEIERTITERVVLRDLASNLASIPGISPRSAVWLLAEVGNIQKFPSVREFLAYCGCVPRTVSSAGKVYFAHISRHSNKFTREIFYHASLTNCHVTKSASKLKQYATRIYQRKRERPKVAYCTIMSKIARIAYAIMRENKPFEEQLDKTATSSVRPQSNADLTVLDRKEIRRAKRALLRIRELKGVDNVVEGIEQLIGSLEEILTKKLR